MSNDGYPYVFTNIPIEGPLPELISEWIDWLRALKLKHGDVVFGASPGEDLGSLPQVEFFLQTTERRCERCRRALNRKSNNCIICGHWTDPKFHFRDRPRD